MTLKELEALERVVAYVLCNEETHYEECLQEGEGEEVDHIYTQALILDDYIKGLYSTGSVPT
jgi:hypothetical protein